MPSQKFVIYTANDQLLGEVYRREDMAVFKHIGGVAYMQYRIRGDIDVATWDLIGGGPIQ